MPPNIRGNDAALAQRLAIAALMLGILGCAALCVDLWVTYPFLTKNPGPIWEICREGIQKGTQPGESFANGWVIVFLLMAIYAVDVARRRRLLRVAVVIAVVGLLANLGKLCLGRWRPKAFFDAEIGYFSGGVLDTFHGLLPWATLGYSGQSLPSGHTAVAITLGIVLCRRWPHASWAFAMLVGMSVLQRISHGHHYPSDCLWGAALACMISAICYHPRLAGAWFDSFERQSTIRAAKHATQPLLAEPY